MALRVGFTGGGGILNVPAGADVVDGDIIQITDLAGNVFVFEYNNDANFVDANGEFRDPFRWRRIGGCLVN